MIADKINAKPNEIFCTSGGCEGNSWIIDNFFNIFYDPLSHSSVIKSSTKETIFFEQPTNPLSVNSEGIINIEDLLKKIKNLFDETLYEFCLVTVCGANNEIGTIQPLNELKEKITSLNEIYLQTFNNFCKTNKQKQKRIYLHVDGTQMLPHMKIDVQNLGIDLMTFSGTKIGCPSGIGFVYIKEDTQYLIDPLIYGEQENGLRGGTENVPYILGLGKAMQLLDTDTSHLESLRDYFINKLLTLPNTKLVGSKINRLPNNVNICFGNIDATALLSYLNLNGIYASSGSACNSNSLEPSHVLKEIGLSDVEANSCIRFTLSNETTVEELEETFSVIERFVTRQNKYLGKGE